MVFVPPKKNLGSRFQHLLRYISNQDLRLTVKTQFLSPNVTYVINLVYDYDINYGDNRPYHNSLRIPFKYKLEEMKEYVTSCVAHVGEGGWRTTELFQFTSTKNEHYFVIQFSSEIKSSFSISIEGVEFCPIDFEKDENKVDLLQPTDDIDWGKRLPDNYTHVVKWSKDTEESMTRKEVYFLLRKGLYINNSQQWFSISKKSKKRVMLPARAILLEGSEWNFLSMPGSRFKEVAESCENNHLAIRWQFDGQLLSVGIMYACYLVFKLPENASVFEGIVIVSFETRSRAHTPVEHHIYLVTPPHTPVINIQSPDEKPSRTRKIKGHPKRRKDGWMEIQVFELYHGVTSYKIYDESGYLKSLNEWNFTGLLVQGVEFRPAKVSWSYSNYPVLK